MVPFRQFLLKIHSRCNLACDYCYVYESADQSWRDRPRFMDHDTVRRAAAHIAEHARTHNLTEVHVVLHGGEPLLVGARRLEELLGVLADALDGVAALRLTLQTNGLRLVEDPALLPVLARHGVRVGVSLDGTAATHDRHRRRPDGRGSHADVARALRLLTDGPYRALYAGVLCTIDLTADPVETYEALLEFSPPRLDLLLPHATWHTPPPGLPGRTTPPSRVPGAGPVEPVPYARWLCAVFDRWYEAPRRETGIRLFEEIVVLLLGGAARSEAVGLAPVDLVVVETDGTIEQADSLKVAYDGAPATGLDVFRHTFTDAARHEAFRARQRGRAGLAPVCAACPRAAVCGGGLYAHRYHPGAAPTPFAAPSVYCADLAVLVDHMADRLRQDVPQLRTAAQPVPR
ncbi:FxsB family radical SAM/SPASM domain protein [Streptomyces canus]|uniref:FxsB family cyclophane-forming radical SAM/SPASM peptide maturase n=1 Tax=Streptomyces canus TaxID=58343 RepID=UPI00224D7A22|nr:FxsB family cyclophane-forming radical SAM/SPASM peptide maturase [Streptomyces canus]MCX4859324.1 FxsB family radical SAM/SPASM domain protein [Streptomyces canus]WSW35420.1 FxsB family radical SAM/SPASM domain protein [Streptomyces canus]